MTPQMRRPRRIVQKSFDGAAAANAFLLQTTVGDGYGPVVETAKFLLDSGICPTDVHKLMGMPLETVRRIGGTVWEGVRVGRVPINAGPIFETPEGHLRVSVFLNLLETISDVSGEETISGLAFASALKGTNVICGSTGKEDIRPRLLFLAVLEVTNGTCSLVPCSTCRVRFLRSRVLLRVHSGLHSHGDCPFCKFVDQKKARGLAVSCVVGKKLEFG